MILKKYNMDSSCITDENLFLFCFEISITGQKHTVIFQNKRSSCIPRPMECQFAIASVGRPPVAADRLQIGSVSPWRTKCWITNDCSLSQRLFLLVWRQGQQHRCPWPWNPALLKVTALLPLSHSPFTLLSSCHHSLSHYFTYSLHPPSSCSFQISF